MLRTYLDPGFRTCELCLRSRGGSLNFMTIITGEFWEIAVFQYFSLKILLRRVTSVSWACEREKTLGGVCHTPEACDLVCLHAGGPYLSTVQPSRGFCFLSECCGQRTQSDLLISASFNSRLNACKGLWEMGTNLSFSLVFAHLSAKISQQIQQVQILPTTSFSSTSKVLALQTGS